MKFKSEVSPLMVFLRIFVSLLLLAFAAYTTYLFVRLSIESETANYFNYIMSGILVMAASYITYRLMFPLFNTSYEIKNNKLYIRSGKKYESLRGASMLVIEDSKKFFTKNCLGMNKLKITYTVGNGREYIHVSPKDKKSFITEIKKIAKSLKVEAKM